MKLFKLSGDNEGSVETDYELDELIDRNTKAIYFLLRQMSGVRPQKKIVSKEQIENLMYNSYTMSRNNSDEIFVQEQKRV